MPRLIISHYGQLWTNCDRCGFIHPRGMLTPQLGLLLCNCHGCWDNLDNQYRPMLIAGVLGNPKEADDNVEQFTNAQDPGELEL